MKIGVLGSGPVGVAMTKGFLSEGHEVWIATREPDGDKGHDLKTAVGEAVVCDYATAAKEAELAVFCVNWGGAEEAAHMIEPENLAGKTVIDTSNPLQPVEGGVKIKDGMSMSAGQMVQGWFSEAHVVKAFNSVGADTMYKPAFDSKPTMFIAGDDAEAKSQVRDITEAFGWEAVDAGSLEYAHELESLAILWINYTIVARDQHHAFKML